MLQKFFQRILVPSDMTEFSALALRYALLFQNRMGSKLTLLYAEMLDANSQPESQLREQLRAFARRVTPDAAGVATTTSDDEPANAIVKTARGLHSDLIVMGTHGRNGLNRLVMGSVAESVLRDSDVPVMTVRPDLADEAASIKTVLCPINFTDAARAALERASAIAEAFEAELIVMHVCEPSEQPLDPDMERQFGSLVNPLIRKQTRFARVVTHGDAAERVLNTASGMHGGLLVIGAQHRRFSDASVIGTTTDRITRFAKIPVLTVMRRAAAMSAVA